MVRQLPGLNVICCFRPGEETASQLSLLESKSPGQKAAAVKFWASAITEAQLRFRELNLVRVKWSLLMHWLKHWLKHKQDDPTRFIIRRVPLPELPHAYYWQFQDLVRELAEKHQWLMTQRAKDSDEVEFCYIGAGGQSAAALVPLEMPL